MMSRKVELVYGNGRQSRRVAARGSGRHIAQYEDDGVDWYCNSGDRCTDRTVQILRDGHWVKMGGPNNLHICADRDKIPTGKDGSCQKIGTDGYELTDDSCGHLKRYAKPRRSSCSRRTYVGSTSGGISIFPRGASRRRGTGKSAPPPIPVVRKVEENIYETPNKYFEPSAPPRPEYFRPSAPPRPPIARPRSIKTEPPITRPRLPLPIKTESPIIDDDNGGGGESAETPYGTPEVTPKPTPGIGQVFSSGWNKLTSAVSNAVSSANENLAAMGPQNVYDELDEESES